MAAIFVTAFSLFYVAKANPSFFNRFQTATATTTMAVLVPGISTTTLVADLGNSAAQGADSGVLALQFLGSSTASTLRVAFEYAQGTDCVTFPTQCDWYADRTLPIASSTGVSLTPSQLYTLDFASSTVGGIAMTPANGGRLTRIFPFATPTRYVRAVISMPVNSLNGMIWAEFIVKRQAN